MDAKELVIGDIVDVISFYIFLYVTLMSSTFFQIKGGDKTPADIRL